MSRTLNHRHQFVAELTRQCPAHPVHIVAEVAATLMRASATLHRLAEARCNGDWPYDNGTRQTVPCASCETGTVPSRLSLWDTGKVCPACRLTARVDALLPPYGLMAHHTGDPRGCVLTLYPVGTSHDAIDNGTSRSRVLYVPAGRR